MWPIILLQVLLLLLKQGCIVQGFTFSSPITTHMNINTVRTSSSCWAASTTESGSCTRPTLTTTMDEPTSDRVLPPQYFTSVYKNDEVENTSTSSSRTGITPWDIGGGQPQPQIVRAFQEGKIKGRIIDAGCGTGENCIYLGQKGTHGGITSILGFDLAPGAIDIAERKVAQIQADVDVDSLSHHTAFWTRPQFMVASCTEIADLYYDDEITNEHHDENKFDIMIDSGLLHCLSNDDAIQYVSQMTRLVKPNTGRAYVGCFSTANPDPWDNPRRLSEEYLRGLFSKENGWEVLLVKDTWWSRPPERGSSQGAFSMALWMEARRLE